MNRDDFSILNKDIIYFDSAATSLKPNTVIDAMNEYYCEYPANIHRGEYNISYKASLAYDEVREKVAKFINADSKEIVFTSGATSSLNMIINDYLLNKLIDGDEVITTYDEHASLILPLFKLNQKGVKIVLVNDENEIENKINEHTKVIALSHITNVLGEKRNIERIIKIAHQNNIIVVVDGAQGITHDVVDVKKMDVDFYVASAHKILGPTGVGFLYGKYDLLKEFTPSIQGGGMNESFENPNEVIFKSVPTCLEAGTPNIAGVIGMGAAIDYINTIGVNNINKYVAELTNYLLDKLKGIPHIILYSNANNGIVSINVDGIFAQDVAYYLDKYNICVRAGNHCAKLLHNKIGVNNTIRISLYFYNTYAEIDKLIDLLSDKERIKKEMI